MKKARVHSIEVMRSGFFVGDGQGPQKPPAMLGAGGLRKGFG